MPLVDQASRLAHFSPEDVGRRVLMETDRMRVLLLALMQDEVYLPLLARLSPAERQSLHAHLMRTGKLARKGS
ncbi:MAG: hypothetical protein DLM67_04735 [Candidatus Nephthysia bennettiae]|nr:MAG: hypothetical protein DLM67_04735 [Candidatus Dormibacteraeota bacterium]